MESKKKSYQLRQNGKKYILTTSSQKEDAIKMDVTSITEKYFSREFTLDELKSLDTIFNLIKTSSDAIDFMDKALRQQKVIIKEYDGLVFIIFYFFSKGIVNKVIIPLGKIGSKLKLISSGEKSADNKFDASELFGKFKSVNLNIPNTENMISTSTDKNSGRSAVNLRHNVEQADINLNTVTDLTKSNREIKITNKYNLDTNEVDTNNIGQIIEGTNTASTPETSQYYQNNLDANILNEEVMKSLQPRSQSFKYIDSSSLKQYESQYNINSVPLPFYEGNQFIDKSDSSAQFIPSYGTNSVEIPNKPAPTLPILNEISSSMELTHENLTNNEIMTQGNEINEYDITNNELMRQDFATNQFTIEDITNKELTTQDFETNQFTTEDITNKDLITQDFVSEQLNIGDVKNNEFITQDFTTNQFNIGDDKINYRFITKDILTKNKFDTHYLPSNRYATEINTNQLTNEDFTTNQLTTEEITNNDIITQTNLFTSLDNINKRVITQAPNITESTTNLEYLIH